MPDEISIMRCFWPKSLSVLFLGFCVCSSILNAQTNKPKEAQVTCVVDLEKPPMTRYGFALATLKSLASARDSVNDGTREIEESEKSDNPFTALTGMLRSFKLSTNDLICAKRAVQPFTSQAALTSLPSEQRKNITTAAAFLVATYDRKIAINDRSLGALKKLMDKGDMAEFSDHVSTLQVESGQVWADLVPPVGMSGMLLVDLRATDENGNFIKATESNPGYAKRLVITKAEKEAFLDWFNKHFPELNDGTPQDKIADPAKTATLYLKAFDGRLCSDEPASTGAVNSAVENQR